MTSILFAGDPHGNFSEINSAARNRKPAALVLLGDYDLMQPLDIELRPTLDAGVEVWWIHGNHDADHEKSHDNLFGSGLKDCSLHGKVTTVAGLRIAGLGGTFDQNIWRPDMGDGKPLVDSRDVLKEQMAWRRNPGPVRGGIPIRHRSSIFWSDYAHRLRQLSQDPVPERVPVWRLVANHYVRLLVLALAPHQRSGSRKPHDDAHAGHKSV